jgi:hypothetical protein
LENLPIDEIGKEAIAGCGEVQPVVRIFTSQQVCLGLGSRGEEIDGDEIFRSNIVEDQTI